LRSLDLKSFTFKSFNTYRNKQIFKRGFQLPSFLSIVRSRMKLLDSFFGLTYRFKIWILSETSEALTFPQWFSIYLKRELRASDENIGVVNAAQNGVKLALWLPGGMIGQKLGGKKSLLFNFAIQALAFSIAFIANDWTWALLMSVILGFRALGWPGAQALIGRITNKATRTTVFALETTILSIVIMLRQPLQGYIAETSGLRPLYLLGAIGTVTSFFIFLSFFPDFKEENKLKPSEKQSKVKPTEEWKRKVRQVFARPEYRRNYIGLLQAGVIWQLFSAGFNPFVDIYLYEEIGWRFLFFGFYGFATSFLAVILRVPLGKLIDKHRLKRIFLFAGPASAGTTALFMVFVKDPYSLAVILLTNSVVDTAYALAESALWYDAIPVEVYSIGVSIRGVVYGFSGMAGSLLGAYLWTILGPVSAFYIKFSSEITRGFVSLYLIRDVGE